MIKPGDHLAKTDHGISHAENKSVQEVILHFFANTSFPKFVSPNRDFHMASLSQAPLTKPPFSHHYASTIKKIVVEANIEALPSLQQILKWSQAVNKY